MAEFLGQSGAHRTIPEAHLADCQRLKRRTDLALSFQHPEEGGGTIRDVKTRRSSTAISKFVELRIHRLYRYTVTMKVSGAEYLIAANHKASTNETGAISYPKGFCRFWEVYRNC